MKIDYHKAIRAAFDEFRILYALKSYNIIKISKHLDPLNFENLSISFKDAI